MNKKPTKINLTSDDSLFEKSLNLQKYLEDLSSQTINLSDKFSFTWAGKSNAIKSVLVPSKLTLNPEPNQSIKWDESENLFIEGDNLEVLKLLQKAYFEKVKMIYIDPPYNTGHDFVYNDDFSAPLDNYLKQTGQKTEVGESVTTNKETNGRYHSDWLSMMYPRLKLAWNLLREDGVIFVSIDDNEVHHLRMLMDEVFGEENFVGDFIRQSKVGGGSDTKFIVKEHEYCLCYSKQINSLGEFYVDHNLDYLKRYKEEDENGKYFWDTLARGGLKNPINFEVEAPDGTKLTNNWNRSQKTFYEDLEKGEIKFQKNKQGEWNVYFKQRLNEDGKKPRSLTSDLGSTIDGKNDISSIFGNDKIFSYPKPVKLIQYLLSIISNNTDEHIILDFFAGSGTTAHAVLNQNASDGGNRKFITIQLPEKLDEKSIGFQEGYATVSDITKERIRRVIKGYGENPQPIDAGFKVFTLSESNYPENTFVFNSEKSSEENQQAFIAYLNKAKQSQLFDKEDDMNIVYENIVKEGLSLNSKVETITIGKNRVHKVSDGEQQLLICLENKLASETVKELTDKTHKGKLFICLESALDDTTAANLSLNLDLKTI